MMGCYWLNEDRLPSKLFVGFSSKITNEIENIDDYNQNNIEGISHWHNYIDGIRSYISNPAIAFDYTNRYSRFLMEQYTIETLIIMSVTLSKPTIPLISCLFMCLW